MNIIFDIGNVLLTFRPREYLQSLFADSDVVDLYQDVIFGSSLWLDLDRGITSEEEVVGQLSACYPGHAQGIRQVFAHWHSMLEPMEDSLRLLYELKEKGYKLYALSNFHREAFHHVREKFSWFGLFDGMVISYEINSIKPEPEIYQTLIDRYGLDPEKSVFIDDVEANLVGARALGFSTIEFKSAEGLTRDLGRLLESGTNS